MQYKGLIKLTCVFVTAYMMIYDGVGCYRLDLLYEYNKFKNEEFRASAKSTQDDH